MQRRKLLKLGVGGATFLAVAGVGVSLWCPGLIRGRLSVPGLEVFRAVGLAVLDGSLPREPAALTRAVDQHLGRVDATIAALPATARTELSRLLAVLSSAPGRIVLAGLADDWSSARVPQVQEALEGMRTSRMTLPQQAYHALRDLTVAAYFGMPSTWEMLGYPGPLEI